MRSEFDNKKESTLFSLGGVIAHQYINSNLYGVRDCMGWSPLLQRGKQKGSIPLCSTKEKQKFLCKTNVWLVNLKTIQKLAHRGTILFEDVVSEEHELCSEWSRKETQVH